MSVDQRYRVQYRYQDSGWESPYPNGFINLRYAAELAELNSRDSIAYGMGRVVDTRRGVVKVEYGAGHPPHRIWIIDGNVYSYPIDDNDSLRVHGDASLSVEGEVFADTPVTATGPDFPPIENRAPRYIRLRDKRKGKD